MKRKPEEGNREFHNISMVPQQFLNGDTFYVPVVVEEDMVMYLSEIQSWCCKIFVMDDHTLGCSKYLQSGLR